MTKRKPVDKTEAPDGLTFRNWLIGMALQGYASTEAAIETPFSDIAHWSVQAADAVLEELARE